MTAQEINHPQPDSQTQVSSVRPEQEMLEAVLPHNHAGHEHTNDDYALAEQARQRNEPPFQAPKTTAALDAVQNSSEMGEWGEVVTWPFAFASAANLPDGRILAWGANNLRSFTGGTFTYASIWDPSTGQFTSRNRTGHPMFCAIPTMMENGRIFVNGGDADSPLTSIFDYRANTWSSGDTMSTGRWYPGTVMLPGDKAFTMLGRPGGAYPEMWTEQDGWSLLTGANLNNGILNQTGYQSTWLPYLHLMPNGNIFHSGPTTQMNIIDPAGSGAVTSAGLTNEWYPKYSATVMYDEGKILVAGGAANDTGTAPGTNRAMIIDFSGSTPTKTNIASMNHARKFDNGVMLPNGEVLIIGGNTSGIEFSDQGTVLTPEIWNPTTRTWREVADMSVPRNYHSVALLMTDGRIWSGGGGLCNCAADHLDHQIYSPPYLFNADGTLATRPVINSAPDSSGFGATIAVEATADIQKFSLIKMSGLTHSLNSDLRFLNVPFSTVSSGSYQLALHDNPNVLTPGYWMLFALNSQGVPSVAKIIQIQNQGNSVRLFSPGNQLSTIGSTISLGMTVENPSGNSLSFTAANLPAGLTIHSTTGTITGTPNLEGSYAVTVTAMDGNRSDSIGFNWTIVKGGAIRFVRFVADSEVNGNPWTSAAEFHVLDVNGDPINRAGWIVSADSQETVGEDGHAVNVIDGDVNTIWHTQWQGANPPHPHELIIDMGVGYTVTGFRYLPRQNGTNGTVANYRFYVSRDGVTWGAPVAQGTFANNAAAKTVTFSLKPLEDAALPYDFESAQGWVINPMGNDTATAGQWQQANPEGTTSNGHVLQLNNTVSGQQALVTGAAAGSSAGTYDVDNGKTSVRSPNILLPTAGPLSVSFSYYLAHLDNATSDDYLRVFVVGSTTTKILEELGEPNIDQASWATVTVSLDDFAGQVVYLLFETADLGSASLIEAAVDDVVLMRGSSNQPPVLTSPGNQTFAEGQMVDIVIAANDPDGDVLSFGATGLPPGLEIDGQTAVITGQLSSGSAGSYATTIIANDGKGGSNSINFTWVIQAAPTLTLDSLTALPQVQNQAVAYTAVSSGGLNPRYKWLFGDGTPETSYSTSPTASHTFTQPGRYIVTVTAADDSGQEVSRQFTQLIHRPLTSQSPAVSMSIVYEARAGNDRVWNVNPDNNSVTVSDAVTQQKLAEINVGDGPRAIAQGINGRFWVTNKHDATITIIDSGSLAVVQTINLPRASQPYGLAFAPDGSAVFIALEATGKLLKLNPSSGSQLGSVDVGATPRHLSVLADSSRVYVSRFISPPTPGEATANPQFSAGGGEVVVVNTSTMTVVERIKLQYSDQTDTESGGRGLPNYLGPAIISPDGVAAWVPSKQDNIARGVLRDGQDLDHDHTVRSITSYINLSNNQEQLSNRLDHDNAGIASSGQFERYGAYLFVALEGSRQVAVVDAYARAELFRFDVGRAPQGIALSSDGLMLFVHNFLDRTLGIYDLTALINNGQLVVNELATVDVVANEQLSPQLLQGKQLFYDSRDSRLALDGYISCAACHNDGGQDGRVWDMTGFGEGLRNTIDLNGRFGTGHGPLHWTANFDEVQDFENQIRTLAGGTGLMSDSNFAATQDPLGAPKAGLSSALDALAAYVTSLVTVADSPYRSSNGVLTNDGVAGRTVFQEQNCAQCHNGAPFTDSAPNNLHDVGTLTSASGGRLGGALTGIDTPTLRGVWNSAPYMHDGSASTLADAVVAHNGTSLSSGELAQLVAFLQQIDQGEPSPTSNSAPTLSNPGNQNNAVGDAVNLSLTGTDPDGDVLTYGATGLPTGLTLNSSSGVIVGTVTTAGSYAVTATVSDGSLTDSVSFTWTVTAGNGAPTLTNPGNQNNAVGDAINLSLTGTDPDGDVLTYGATGLPTGLALNSSSGVIVGTVTTAGSYAVTATVSDGSLTDSVSFTWVIEPATDNGNLALGRPAAQSSTGWEGVAVRAVDGNTSGNWPDSSTTHTAGGDLHAWWQVDLGSVTTIGQVHVWNRTDCCSYRLSNFYLLISDQDLSGRSFESILDDPAVWRAYFGGAVGSDHLFDVDTNGRFVRIQLAGVDYLSLAEVQVFAGDQVSNKPPTLIKPANQNNLIGDSIALPLVASDPDGDTITYQATGLPAGLLVNGSSGIITGSPTTAGSYAVVATATDSHGAVASVSFTWTVSQSTGNGNLALGRPATQSSIGWGGEASRAVDGNTSGDWFDNSVTHTAGGDLHAWWQVDLGGVVALDQVHLWNRTDCCDYRLANFYIFVSDEDLTGRSFESILDDPTVWRAYQGNAFGVDKLFDLNTNGRFVRVQLVDVNYLALAEVQIFGGG